MAEEALFVSDYDGPCPLCEEDEQIGYCRYRNTEHANESEIKNDAEDKESQEFKRDSEVKPEEIAEENWTVVQEPEERKTERKEEENKTEANETEDTKQKSTEEEQNKKEHNAESDEQSKKEEQDSVFGLKDDERKTDDEDDDNEEARDLLVAPLEDDCILQMGPDCTIDLVMVCDQPRCVNEDLSLCPPKSSDFSQQAPIKSPPKPLSITLPPQNPTILPFLPHPLLPAQVPAQAQLEPQCLGKRPYGSSPAVDPQAMRPLEVTLRQVYTTRQYTRFASRAAPMPLASVGGETSTQALPSISTDVPLLPPKKKTRTFYSTDQLEELERVFQDDHYPDGDKRKEIAASIGVTPQRIMVWFQNRRAKWRKTSKTTTKKPASRGQTCVQVNRPAIFHAPSQHPKPGNTLPPYSTIRTSRTSPAGPGCVDMAPCVSQGGFLEYMPPPMHSPPPIRRASLPLITAYNPSTHTVSLLLDTPEHSEPSSTDTTPLSLQTDTGFDYEGMGTSVKMDFMTSASQNSTLNYQLNTFSQQSNTLLTQQTNSFLSQQTNTLLPQQTSCLMPQQSCTLLPQYSHLSYLTPSPYLTPAPTESSSAPYQPLTNNTLPTYTSSGHAYLHSQTSNQMLLHSGVHAFQAYPWTTDMYSQPGPYTQAVFRPQLSSQGPESQYTQLLPQQHYVQLQGAPAQPSLPKPTTDPLLPNVKVESEDTSQPIRGSEAEPTFHCDFSPINF
ncbi:homeobox protein NOBOX-like [Pimephales promelas]|uniref:homeobox protein NOBOX-like n=1 Tax=Pimephales promelas TaxID=90988 RepID=UPI0019557478|nr:homeobox protein NOBOX-like [Pimephales promelas]KAG1946898.1 homeobox protein NOBOX [Pimephales promelas]